MKPGAPAAMADPGTLRELFQALPVGVVVADSAGRIMEANPAAEALLGLSREEQAGREISSPAWEIVRLDTSPMPPEEFASVRALKEGRVVRDVEMGLIRPDGERIWLNVTAAPAEGGVVLITFQDIGHRVRGAAIGQAHARLMALPEGGGVKVLLVATLDELELLTGSRIGFFHLLDPDGENLQLQVWSTRTEAEHCRAEGHESHFPVSLAGIWAEALRQARPVIHDDVSREPGRKGLPPGHAELARELVVPVIRHGRVKALVGLGNKPAPYTPEDIATVQRLAGHAWEMADLQLGKDDLRRSEDLMERTFAHSPNGMALVSLEGRYLKVNRALCSLLGRSEEEMLDLGIRELTHPEDRAQDQEGIADLLAGRRPRIQLDKRYLHKDGQAVWAQVTVSLLRDEQGQPLQFVAQIRDLGERLRSDRERALTLRVLQILNETEDPEIAAALLLHEVRESLGIEAAAIRLAQRDDFTYAAHEGFPRAFVEAENCLRSRTLQGEPLFDGEGRPLFDCTCGVVLMGLTDPANPLFTPGGSAWTNDALPFKDLPLAQDPRHSPRNRCIHVGYRSIALVPIRSAEGIVGLLQLNDSRPDCFDLQGVVFLEGIASTVGLAIERRRVHERLANSLQQLQLAHAAGRSGFWSWDSRTQAVEWSPTYFALLGWEPGKVQPSFETWMDSILAEDRPRVEREIRAVLEEGRDADLEWRALQPDGSVRWILSRSHVKRGPEGAVQGIMGIAIDITERKAMEQALEASEARFRHISETAEEWIWEVDAGGLYTYSSPVVERLLGYAPEELVGRVHFFDLWPRADREALLPAVEALFRRREAMRDLPNTIVRKDGTLLRVETTGVPVLDGQGRLLGYRGVDRNITQREAAQKELRLSEERFSTAFRLSPVPMAISRLGDMRTLDVNEAWQGITGIPVAEAMGVPLRELAFAMEPEQREDLILALQRKEGLHNHPVRLQRRDGSWVDLLMSAQTTELGGESCVLSSAQDVTDLRKAQEALMESEARFRGLFDHSPVAVWVEDLSRARARFQELREAHVGDLHRHLEAHPEDLRSLAQGVRILDVNSAGLTLMGAEDAADLSRDLPSYFHEDSLPALRELLVALFEGRTEFESEITLLDALGRRLDLQLSLSVLPGHEATLSRVLVTVADLTARRAAEVERREMERELSHLQRIESLGRLASGVSHDMNNVLGAIMAVGSVLQSRHPQDQAIVKDTETLLQAACRGRDLVKGLRDFSRKELESATDLDLNQLARREADLLERTTLKRVEVRLDLATDLPQVFGDGSAILNALMNLCANSVDAMPRGGRLTLITRNLGQGFVELAVQDTGEGMSPEVMSRALEPFYTTKPTGQGTGLGLSQVYGTMKAHGGTVDIQSQVGMGTRVSLAFPAASTKALREPEPDPEAGALRRQLAILLVDDEDLIRGSVKRLLEALGNRVQDASSGLEALRRLKGGQEADLVILDLNMPVMDGEETLARLRLLRPDLPVLLATGYADDRVPAILKRFPQVKILMKPFSIQDMERVLARWP